MAAQTIHVSSGAAEYTLPVTLTEATGKNIAADTVLVSLAATPGGYTTAGAWVTPSIDVPQTNPATRVVQLFVDSSILPGVYWLWVKITDSPEIAPRRALKVTVT